MQTIIYIILAVVVIFSLLGIIYIVIYNNIQNIIIRTNESESIIDEALRERFDLIVKSEEIIKDNVKVNLDSFEEVKELKNQNISNFDFDRKTTECINFIYQLKKDYTSLENNANFKDIIQGLNRSAEKIESAKSFYNKYTTKLNKYIRKFPSNIIAKIHKIYNKGYFDNKDMDDDIIDDFKI